ncbi:hypothetical protein ACFYTC_46205 [Actinomadura nitritigenes]|uniref:hypothetical protein n=1 Tax=Actinomadura nitritigenes TaxID=134602 RepID=UPI0036A28814
MAVEHVVHTLEPDVVEAGDDLGVDLLQYFEAVTRPLGHLSRRDGGIQAPGDAAVAEVVRAAQDW